jgi:predicted ribosomally synthesized peptide with SipW-like signal peptide
MGKTAGRKKRIIITTAAMLAIGGGAAFAYWTATGTADATTTAGSASGFTIVSKAPAGTTPLSPGAEAQTVEVTVTNPGTGVQKLKSVVVTVAEANGFPWTLGSSPLTCSAADFTVGEFTVDNNKFAGAEVPANGSVTGTVTLQMNNRATVNQDKCQGAPVPLHFAAS